VTENGGPEKEGPKRTIVGIYLKFGPAFSCHLFSIGLTDEQIRLNDYGWGMI